MPSSEQPRALDPAVSRVLDALSRGEPRAAEELLPLVYAELRRLAAAKLARESPGQTLQATALVHEAYLRLVGPDPAAHWDGQGHFFAAAAEAMRRILVESARARKRLKRGGDVARLDLDLDQVADVDFEGNLLDVDEALTRLGAVDSRAAEVVKLRVFAGRTVKEVAGLLGVSSRTVDNLWAYARAWLLAELHCDDA